MGLLKMIKTSLLGLGGNQPQNFGVNPVPPNSLHDTFSVDGKPDVTWRSINNVNQKPLPSKLDELDKDAPKLIPGGVVSKAYKSSKGQTYMDNKPE